MIGIFVGEKISQIIYCRNCVFSGSYECKKKMNSLLLKMAYWISQGGEVTCDV